MGSFQTPWQVGENTANLAWDPNGVRWLGIVRGESRASVDPALHRRRARSYPQRELFLLQVNGVPQKSLPLLLGQQR